MTSTKFDINTFVKQIDENRKEQLTNIYLQEKKGRETLQNNYSTALEQIENGNLECYKTAKNLGNKLGLPINESTKLIDDSLSSGFKTLIDENTEIISKGNIDTTYQIIRILEELKTNKFGLDIDRSPLGNALTSQIDTLAKKYRVKPSELYIKLKKEETPEWLRFPCYIEKIENGNLHYLTKANETITKYGFSKTELNKANNTGISICQEKIEEIYKNASDKTIKIFDECKTIIESHAPARPDILLKGYQIIETILINDKIKEKILKKPKGYGGAAASIASTILSGNITPEIIKKTCDITLPTLKTKHIFLSKNLPADIILNN